MKKTIDQRLSQPVVVKYKEESYILLVKTNNSLIMTKYKVSFQILQKKLILETTKIVSNTSS